MNLKCPKCGSSNVCEILYGMPTGEAYKLAEQGKIILVPIRIYNQDNRSQVVANRL